MRETPQQILYLRPDTIGDLVIFSAALDALLEAWPDARHTVLVRSGYESLAPLFSPALHWQVAPLNPFVDKPSQCASALTGLLSTLDASAPDLVVAATVNRTWLELAIAAHFPEARRVALGDRAVDPIFAGAARLELGLDSTDAFGEIVRLEEGARDWENNHRLVEQLVGHPVARRAPRITIPAAASDAADSILTSYSLAGSRWIAVFPAGLANVPIKAWPAEKFASLVIELQSRPALPLLLLGHRTERELLQRVSDLVVADGGAPIPIWCGEDGQVDLLAALLAKAEVYIGHDTGAMHLSAAAGRPTLGIFGGGHWPRFRPIGRQTVSVVQPLPCFGCNWDCHFGDAPCVKTLGVADVRRGVDVLLAGGSRELDEVITAENLPPAALRLIEAEVPRYIALQRDRIARQHRIEELKRETDSKDVEISSLKNAADLKDDEIASLKRETDTKDDEISDLKSETNSKDIEIADLKRAATERKTEMEAIKAELEAECAGKDIEIAELKKETDGKDVEIAALKRVSNEREQLIFTLDGHVKEFQRIVGVLNSQIAELDRRRTELDAAHQTATTALAESEQRRVWLEERFALIPNSMSLIDQVLAKDVHIRNLDASIVQRDAEIARVRAALAASEQSIANYAAGFGTLEQAKHYGKLLSEKEGVIQTLHRACLEREAVIKQLVADVTKPTSKARKIWVAGSAHAREKWWRPLESWLFRQTVENYWMQIGVLRHYEPRPLVFDKFPKPKLSESKLPQIGIVTPSYNQAQFIGSTMLSVLNQNYSKLIYTVQDGASRDGSSDVIAQYAARLRRWESAPDQGQADAIRRGFSHIYEDLAANDIMAWLNSDDLLAPRSLRFVAEYFATHPEVDVIYGHRIIIDGHDKDVGRWVMPRHDPEALQWIDYVPQETLFWRKSAWDLAGGIDPSFQFALDWDLLARFTQAGCRIRRLPYFLGCFRVHADQKTSHAIHTTGADEMRRIRTRFHGDKQDNFETINAHARRTRFRGALNARLLALGIRW